MKTRHSFTLNPCHSVRGRNWQPDTEKTKRLSFIGWILLAVMILLLVVPLVAFSKGSPDGNGGGKGDDIPPVVEIINYGDVFGDLIHIYRDGETGQPIFAQRWIEMPAELPGYGWGYCAMVFTDYEVQMDKLHPEYGTFILDENDERILAVEPVQIPFLPYSCDLDPAFDDEDMVVEVDYFGRLNASRTMERNQRMHFNEVITNINQAGALKLDPVGRLMLGYDCAQDCLWSTIDSPMESMALYARLMKYGHFATDPAEEDLWWHGDPALYTDGEVPVHPALDELDYKKFEAAGLEHLLPVEDQLSSEFCWDGGDFNVLCAENESLTVDDFHSAGIYLGAAASKTGWVSVDLIQYLNRFLSITQDTEITNATPDILPALYLDCYDDDLGLPEDPHEDDVIVDDLVYGDCELKSAVANDGSTPNYFKFYNIQEMFMNFGFSGYTRATHLETAKAELILQANLSDVGIFSTHTEVPLIDWVDIPNTLQWTGLDFDYDINIANFVIGANDTARSVEYIHNYAIPEDLYCKYAPEDPMYCLPVN